MGNPGGRKNLDKPDYIKWALLAIVALVMAATGAYYAYRLYRPSVDVAPYPVRGIDVSGHNASIQWHRVADAGIRFVFIKASEGRSYTNPRFDEQYAGATKAGIKVGVYHFFRKGSNGAEQAKHFLATIGDRDLDMPLVVDVEDDANDDVETEVVMQRLRDMIATLNSKGWQVMIYTNGNGVKRYYKDKLGNCDLWLSSFRQPAENAALGHRIQQYSHWGSVDGIEGDVDMNVFIGSENEWNEWLRKFN